MTDEGTSSLNIEIAVGERLDREIFLLADKLRLLDEHLIPAAEERVSEADRRAQNSDRDEDHADRDLMQDRLVELLNQSTVASRQLQTLRSPEELQRRNKKAHINHISLRRLKMSEETTVTKTKKPTAADKGAPAIYLNDDGKFRIGMDARFKSDLVNCAVGIVTPEKPGHSLQTFTPDEAEKLIAAFDWGHFLSRKKEILDATASKKVAAQAARDEAARVKAAEKAEKDAAKAAEKAANVGESTPSKTGTSSKTDQARALREAAAAAAE